MNNLRYVLPFGLLRSQISRVFRVTRVYDRFNLSCLFYRSISFVDGKSRVEGNFRFSFAKRIFSNVHVRKDRLLLGPESPHVVASQCTIVSFRASRTRRRSGRTNVTVDGVLKIINLNHISGETHLTFKTVISDKIDFYFVSKRSCFSDSRTNARPRPAFANSHWNGP